MSLYELLLALLPPRAAGGVTALIYALLIGLMILLAPTPPADFRYGAY